MLTAISGHLKDLVHNHLLPVGVVRLEKPSGLPLTTAKLDCFNAVNGVFIPR